MSSTASSATRPVLAFVHIEKTAGTTLKSILRNTFGCSHCDTIHTRRPLFTREDYQRARRWFPGLRSLCGHNLWPSVSRLPPEVRLYTILREPLARTASQYQDACVRGSETRTLEAWLAEPRHRNAQVQRIAGIEDLEAAQRILLEEYLFAGIAERFEDTLRLLAAHSPYPLRLRYFDRNRARDNRIKRQALDDPNQRALLASANNLDLALYRYASEELFPAALETLPSGSPPPQPVAEGRRPPRDRASDIYNKLVWRQYNKWRNRNGAA